MPVDGVGLLRAEFMLMDALAGVHPKRLLALGRRQEFVDKLAGLSGDDGGLAEALAAAEQMLERTHTEWAPWTVVEATDARWTRVKVFRALVERMEEALRRRQAAPAAVSRTRAAVTATRLEREEHDRESLRLAAVEAGGAGLPLEED